MLSVRDLTVRYGRTPAVEDLDLEVEEGEIVGLVGPNGAGKSTTLAAIVGLVPVAGGEIVLPRRVARRPSRRRRSRDAGSPWCMEGRHIFATLTVGENLALGEDGESRPRGPTRRSSGSSTASRFCRRPSVGPREPCPAASSSSSRSPVRWSPSRACSCWTSRRSAWRPCSSTRSSSRSPRSGARGATVLLVEQNVRRTVELADRTYVLRSGRLALSGTRAELGRAERARDRLPRVLDAPARRRDRAPRDPERHRRDLAGQPLRPVRTRRRGDLRGHAPDQLRPRRADHGRRLRDRAHLAAGRRC